jgi:hypothetical protein
LKTPEKFRHPKYEKLVWLAAEGLQKEFEKCKTESSVANEFLLPSAKSLYTTLSSWSRDRKHCKEIPESVNEVQLLGILENCVALAQEKYGVDCDPSTSPSQWQRSSFVSGDPLKLKLKRDSSIKPRQAPSTSRSPKQSRKRLKESSLAEDDDQGDDDFVYLDLYDELQAEEESDDHNWVPGDDSRYVRKKSGMSSKTSSGRRDTAKTAMKGTSVSSPAKISKVQSSLKAESPHHPSKQATVYHKFKGSHKSKLLSSKQRLGKILGIKGSTPSFHSLKK